MYVNNKFYKYLSMPFIIVLNLLFQVLGYLVYKDEKYNSDIFNSLGQSMILKKRFSCYGNS